jgi:hypothetical protein
MSPGGFERFFREMGEPARDLTRPPVQEGPPDIGAVVSLARRHSCEIEVPGS